MNRQILLNARPQGDIKYSDFKLVETERPVPGDKEVLIKTLYLAVEPAMRGWMENRSDYVAPLELGDVMRSYGVGRVIESNNPAFPVDTLVGGSIGWQEYLTSDGKSVPLQSLPTDVDIPATIGVLGITGLTAYFGLLKIGQPIEGDTVLVSGAAGATGSIAGQLAKLAGCRVIGLAGSAEKCDWLTGELGFDGAINYREENVAAAVKQHCPKGINVYYDNVGGEILDIALANIAQNARVVICGGISRYNLTGEIPGPKNYFNLVFRRSRMEGFIVSDFAAEFPEAIEVLSDHLRSGRLRHRESILEGFEKAPDAVMNLFSGANIGKQLVKVAD
jgi:NADPH-dependent curcumin reductase CurA